MKTKIIILSLVAMSFMVSSVNAQWRIGATMGATYNHYSIDTRYMSGINYANAWGCFSTPNLKIPVIGTFGFIAQYDVLQWLGVRADLNWTSKSHKVSIPQTGTDYKVHNGYIQLPVMASFSLGYKKNKVFCNLGIYGAYWVSAIKDGKEGIIPSQLLNDCYVSDFYKCRDQRFDYGLVGGIGVERYFNLFKIDWAWQIEARVYYSTQSTQKHYMRVNDPRYNTTLALQGGLCYFF